MTFRVGKSLGNPGGLRLSCVSKGLSDFSKITGFLESQNHNASLLIPSLMRTQGQ